MCFGVTVHSKTLKEKYVFFKRSEKYGYYKSYFKKTSPLPGHSPVVVVSVVGAEHHAVVNGHRAVFTKQFRGSVQETVPGIPGVSVHRHHVVGRL